MDVAKDKSEEDYLYKEPLRLSFPALIFLIDLILLSDYKFKLV